MGSDSLYRTPMSRQQLNIISSRATDRSRFQKSNGVQCLLYIRHLVIQAGNPPLKIQLHKLIFPTMGVVVSQPLSLSLSLSLSPQST